MGVAIRDFIPDGEATPAEKSRMQRGKIIRTGANHDDFIPDPDDPTPPAHTSSAEERMEKAARWASKRAEWASEHAFSEAQLRLKDMTPATAVQAIEVMPQATMELYVAAETLGANRADILAMFPPIDPAIIDRYRKTEPKPEAPKPDADALLQAEVSAIPDIPEEEVKAKPDTSTEEEIAETYLCMECDHAPFKSLAGLKSHQSAKHPD